MGLLARLPAASGSMAARLTTCFGNHCNTSRERRGFVRTCLCSIPLQNFLEITARPFRNPHFSVQATAVTSDDFNLWMRSEPRGDALHLPIWEQIHWTFLFQVNHAGAVGASLLPGPFVNAHHTCRSELRNKMSLKQT